MAIVLKKQLSSPRTKNSLFPRGNTRETMILNKFLHNEYTSNRFHALMPPDDPRNPCASHVKKRRPAKRQLIHCLLMGTAKDRLSVTMEVLTTRLTEPETRARKSFLYYLIHPGTALDFTVLDGTKVSVEISVVHIILTWCALVGSRTTWHFNSQKKKVSKMPRVRGTWRRIDRSRHYQAKGAHCLQR